MKNAAIIAGGVAVTALGMLGLYMKIEFSGWAFAIGLLTVYMAVQKD